MIGKQKFLKAMDINACRRCCLRCSKKDDEIAHKYLAGRWPDVKTAPDPSLIIWENLGKGNLDRCGRSTASNCLAFFLLILGFAVIIYLLNLQEQYKQSAPICGDIQIAQEDAFLNYQRFNSFETDLNSCFCLQEFKTRSIEVENMLFSDGSKPCKDWLNNYTLTTTLGYVISFFISALNGILRFTLRVSTKFEGHHDVTSRLSSAFSKMWIVQFVNTAVILLIINNKLSEDGLIQRVLNSTGTSSFLFNGDYSDFTSEWYGVVGITLFTTAFINGITPAINFAFWFLAFCKRCFDTGCTCNQRKTQKTM